MDRLDCRDPKSYCSFAEDKQPRIQDYVTESSSVANKTTNMHASILQSHWVDDIEFHEYSRHEENHSDRIPSVLRQNQAFPRLFMLAHVVASSSNRGKIDDDLLTPRTQNEDRGRIFANMLGRIRLRLY